MPLILSNTESGGGDGEVRKAGTGIHMIFR